MTFASRLPVQTIQCNEVLNQGTCIFVIALEDCANEPNPDTITVDTTDIDPLADTASLVSDNADGTFLRAGHILHFDNGTGTVIGAITILDDVTVTTTPTLVNIETYDGVAIVAGTTATTFALLELLSPENIPFNLEANTVDRTDLKSFNKSMVKTNNSFNPQIQAIASPDDNALWQIFQGARSVQDVYAVIAYPSEQLVFGRALISGYNFDGNFGEIQRPQFTLEFQGKDYAISTSYRQAATAEQTLMNEVARAAGIAEYTV